MALALDLALQGAGVGRDPDRRPVGLGPQARRARDSPGSCRRRCRPRPASCAARPRVARLEGEGGLGGEVGLGRARLVEARGLQQLRPAGCGRCSGSTGAEPASPRGASSSHSGQARPDVEARAAILALAQRPARSAPSTASAPGPAGAAQGLGQGQGLLAAADRRGSASSASRAAAASRSAAACASAPLGSGRPSARARPAGEGAQNRRRPHEGEQLQRVEQVGDRGGGDRPSRRAVRRRGRPAPAPVVKTPSAAPAPDLARALVVADRPRARRHGERRRQDEPGLGAGQAGGWR